MPRDRQRAKQRQAERRAERLRERDPAGSRPQPERDGTAPADAPSGAGADEPDLGDPILEAQLAASAPPEDAGRSDTVVESPPPAPDTREDEDVAADEQRLAREEKQEAKKRGRVTAFLAAVWAELQRVQWPERKQLTTLTGVVLGFVLIAGGYLGLLDAIFSRLVQAIL